MDQKEMIEKKKELSKLNIIVAIISIVLAFTFVLFICKVVPLCESLTDLREVYEKEKDFFEDLSSNEKEDYLYYKGRDEFPTWAEFCNDYAGLPLATVSEVFIPPLLQAGSVSLEPCRIPDLVGGIKAVFSQICGDLYGASAAAKR